MTFRTRLLIGIAMGAIIPLVIALFGVRREVAHTITGMYDQRLASESRAIGDAIAGEAARAGRSLSTLISALQDDDRFRLGAVRRDPGERGYVLDYAERAMRLTGLSMLQLQDDAGRILTSGHFPREYDRLDSAAVKLLSKAGAAGAITTARTPDGSFLALARVDSFAITGKRFYLTGGIAIDSAFLARFNREDSVRVTMVLGDSVPRANAAYGQTVPIAYADLAAERLGTARFVIEQSRVELTDLLRDANRAFIVAFAAVVAGVTGLGIWLASRLSRPLAELATAVSHIDLDGEAVSVAATRDDEVGTVARRLNGLAQRLGASAERLKNAERRATVGDMARQVNHDIKNGLIPIRNVLRHLGEVSERQPDDLPSAFRDRRGTLDSSVTYLDTLARNYARLTPRIDRVAIDVNAVAREAAVSASLGSDNRVRTRLAPALPPVTGDRIVLRRILDNLIRNGLESLNGAGGEVVVATAPNAGNGILVTVSDTGRGMSGEEVARAFDDFFTTKETGTGLGLSVVRRLTSDLGGSVRVESAPGRGTTFTLEFPG